MEKRKKKLNESDWTNRLSHAQNPDFDDSRENVYIRICLWIVEFMLNKYQMHFVYNLFVLL